MIANLLERGALRITDMNGRIEILRFMTRFQGIELGECDAILSCLKMRHQGERQGVCLMTRGQGRRQNRLHQARWLRRPARRALIHRYNDGKWNEWSGCSTPQIEFPH